MNIRKFGKDTFLYAISNASLRAASFLLIPLYTHYLEISEYGLLATILLTIQLFIILIEMGIRRSYVRFAPIYEERKQIGKLIASSLVVKLFNAVILFSILFIFLGHLYDKLLNTTNSEEILLLAGLSALAQTFNSSALSFFRARNESKPFLILSLITVFILVLANIVWIIVLNKGILGVLYAQIIAYSSIAVMVLIWLVLKHHFIFSFKTAKQLLSYGIPLVLAMSGDIVLETSAVYMLGFFKSMEDVAIYSLGYKIAQISAMVVLYPFQMAFEPFVFIHEKNKNLKYQLSRLFTYYILAFLLVAFLIIVFFKDAIYLVATKDYSQSYPLIFFLLPGFLFAGLHFIGQTLLHIKNKTRVSGFTIISFTIIAIIANYFLIPLFGIYSVILIFNLTLIGITIVLLYYGFKIYPIELEKKRLSILVIIGLFIFILMLMASDQSSVIFYGAAFIGLLATILVLFLANFFSESEKTALKMFIKNFKPAGFKNA